MIYDRTSLQKQPKKKICEKICLFFQKFQKLRNRDGYDASEIDGIGSDGRTQEKIKEKVIASTWRQGAEQKSVLRRKIPKARREKKMSSTSQKGKIIPQTSSGRCYRVTTNTDVEKGCVESNQINKGRNGKCRDSEGKKKKRRTNKMRAKRNQKRRSDKTNDTREAGGRTLQGMGPGDG
jgi:hypothetical protein